MTTLNSTFELKGTGRDQRLVVDGVETTPKAAIEAIDPRLRIVFVPNSTGEGGTVGLKLTGLPDVAGLGTGRSWRSGWGVTSRALAVNTSATIDAIKKLLAQTPVVRKVYAAPVSATENALKEQLAAQSKTIAELTAMVQQMLAAQQTPKK